MRRRQRATSPATPKPSATNQPEPRPLMAISSESSGGTLCTTQAWNCGTTLVISHSSGTV